MLTCKLICTSSQRTSFVRRLTHPEGAARTAAESHGRLNISFLQASRFFLSMRIDLLIWLCSLFVNVPRRHNTQRLVLLIEFVGVLLMNKRRERETPISRTRASKDALDLSRWRSHYQRLMTPCPATYSRSVTRNAGNWQPNCVHELILENRSITPECTQRDTMTVRVSGAKGLGEYIVIGVIYTSLASIQIRSGSQFGSSCFQSF